MADMHEVAGFLWNIADEVLRDDFKRSKYPDVILPFVVLRRLDCVLTPTKDKVLQRAKDLKAKGITKVDGQLRRASGYAFYNTSKFDIQKLLDDPKNIAKNLINYINGFSENVRDILDNFNLRNTITQLDQKGLLFLLIHKFASPKADLHPDAMSNHDVGYVFEELIRRFNEQSNENPGEHFTPREVILLMVRLVLNGDKKIWSQPGVVRTIYDPACGTGGMLSVAKEYILKDNPQADIRLFGQEVNDETYAICKSDMLIKGEDRDADNIKPNSTLSADAHSGSTFDYQLSNPPYGKDWNKDADDVRREARSASGGRFAGGLPRKSDGQMLFLEHMVSKIRPVSEEGGRMGIVMNGSPLFTGDAGSGESEIRRWILENDWLETIVSLPKDLFYNTGITTYIWVLTNRKPKHLKGKVLLLNGAATTKENGNEKAVFAAKMLKSLGNKRNEITPEHIEALAAIAAESREGLYAKVFDTTDFAYRKITVERPLRLNFQTSPERIERVRTLTPFQNLATSKKKDKEAREKQIAEGQKLQKAILEALQGMDVAKLCKNRKQFDKALTAAMKPADIKLPAAFKKAVILALSERDETADICTDPRGNPESDSELRDYECVPFKEDINEYFEREVKPHVPDAWIDEKICDKKDKKVGRVGYEISFNRYFYHYTPPRPLEEIESDLEHVEREIADMLKELTR